MSYSYLSSVPHSVCVCPPLSHTHSLSLSLSLSLFLALFVTVDGHLTCYVYSFLLKWRYICIAHVFTHLSNISQIISRFSICIFILLACTAP